MEKNTQGSLFDKSKIKDLQKNGKIILFVVVSLLFIVFVLKVKKGLQMNSYQSRMLKRSTGIPSNETIFIAITSGLSQLEKTAKCVGHIFDHATFPTRVFVGVCQLVLDDNLTSRKSGGLQVWEIYDNL